jgi:tRNA A-37 threonylcarbamoyl transferase component Bud32
LFRWIRDIALGVAELEEVGIYHADLALRNTIRVTHGKWSAFKIIDFDRAFKVMRTVDKDKAFELVKQLFDFWLKSNYQHNGMRPPIDVLRP